MKNILFVCRHNKFRSKIAEAYFKKITKKKINVSSSGIIVGSYPLDKLETELAKNFGIKMSSGRPRPTTIKLLQKQDIVIIAADDVPKDLFNYDFMKSKLTVWKITDDHYDNINHINLIVR
ncbi:MAG: hypothetical protein Q8N88_07370 [Nanoarchaeota archaeon]|nr:hypothetical protein [Nanoarchaeota archaeon]